VRCVATFTTVRDGFHFLGLTRMQCGRLDVGLEENTTLLSKSEIII
jgi:hypothetical protein